MTSTGPGPGWYPDPAGSGGQRYFDGTAWTEHWVPPAAPPPVSPPMVPPPQVPYGTAPYPAPPYAVSGPHQGYGAYPGYGGWAPPWKGAELGRPPSGPGALADPGRRLAAWLLDGLLLAGVLVVLSGITLAIVAPHVGPVFPDTSSNNGNGPTPGFVWLYVCVIACAFVTGLISIAYETFATARYGRTLGKRWMHIRPLRMDGLRLSGWRALGRSATRAGLGVLSWIGLLDPLWCLWDDKRQCLHDKVVDTIVVNDPAPGELSTSPTGEHVGAPGAAPVAVPGMAPFVAPGLAPGYWPPYGYVPASYGPKTNPLAIASLACSAAGFILFGLPSIAGVILGFVSRAQIRRSNGWQNGSGIALSGIIVGFVVAALFALVVILPFALSTSSTMSSFPALTEKPPPGYTTHPITHGVTALPSWMTSSGLQSGDVSMQLENRVVQTLWSDRQQALVRLDLDQAAVVDQPGSEALATDKALIELTAVGGQNTGLATQADIGQVIVPSSAATYPLAFLGEIATPEVAGGDAQVTLLVITKRSATTPWRVAFTTDYSTPGATPQYLFPTPGATSIPFPPASVPDQLAAYWQYWLDDHRAPSDSPFGAGYWTTTLGKQIAAHTQGEVENDGLDSSRIDYRAAYGPWTFGATGELPVICTGIDATATYQAVSSSNMNQDHYRQNWGGLLAPGEYRRIVDTSVHPSCILEGPDHDLSVFGGDLAEISTGGERP